MTNLWPHGFSVMRLQGGAAVNFASPDSAGSADAWLRPGADGSLFFRTGGAICNGDLRMIGGTAFKGMAVLPTEDARFFLALQGQDNRHNQVVVCTTADLRPIFTVKDVELMPQGATGAGWGLLPNLDARIRYLPSANVLLTLPPTDDRIVLHKFDLFQSLDQSGKNYLFILSVPKTRVRSGTVYTYSILARSRAGGLRFALDAGPEGMTVSGSGMVRWQVPTGLEGKPQRVLVSVRDAAGTNIFHTFELVVE